MNWEAVSASGEIIGAGAVIVTLIYLAIQIRQGINTVQGATEVELSKQFADYHARIAQLFFMLEGFFRQYKRKLLDEESWRPLEVMLLGFLQKDLVAAWWGERAAPISPAFRDHIDNALHRGEHHNVRPARVIGKAH